MSCEAVFWIKNMFSGKLISVFISHLTVFFKTSTDILSSGYKKLSSHMAALLLQQENNKYTTDRLLFLLSGEQTRFTHTYIYSIRL